MDNAYNRSRPSARYADLLAQYRQMHERGTSDGKTPAEKTFDGRALFTELPRLGMLFKANGVKTVLDYGCGKARYHTEGFEAKLEAGSAKMTAKDFWGVESVSLYDPGYAPYSSLPQGTFDAVISTDVMEHLPESDVPWVLGEIFSFARKLVFVNVASYPAVKTLPDGTNAHCTVQPTAWWRERLAAAAAGRPGVKYVCVVDTTGKYKTRDPFSGRVGEELIEG